MATDPKAIAQVKVIKKSRDQVFRKLDELRKISGDSVADLTIKMGLYFTQSAVKLAPISKVTKRKILVYGEAKRTRYKVLYKTQMKSGAKWFGNKGKTKANKFAIIRTRGVAKAAFGQALKQYPFNTQARAVFKGPASKIKKQLNRVSYTKYSDEKVNLVINNYSRSDYMKRTVTNSALLNVNKRLKGEYNALNRKMKKSWD